MSQKKTVVVTGAAGAWGARVTAALQRTPGIRLVGIDARPPAQPLPGVDYWQADIRDESIADFLRDAHADTVVHLTFHERSRRKEAVFDSNVLGTMHLVGSCADAGVRKLVLRSSTMVYGARANNPMYLPESWPLHASSRHAYVREMIDIEKFVIDFRREYPDLIITVLRLANVVGHGVHSALNNLLAVPVVPSLLGFDPLLQVIHVDDAVAAIAHAAAAVDLNGVVNVAAEGVLPLWQILGLSGRPTIPVLHPLANPTIRVTQLIGLGRLLVAVPFDPDYLRYPWVADNRRMTGEFFFAPALNAEQALRTYLGNGQVAAGAAAAAVDPAPAALPEGDRTTMTTGHDV